MKSNPVLPLLVATVFATGCQSYVNSPAVAEARAAKREAFSDPLLARAFHARPAMRFPATIALATDNLATREQIRALSARGALDRVKSLPAIANVATLSPLLAAKSTKPDLVAREAAARLHADAVLLVSTETQATDGKILAPLTAFTLGMLPNKHYEIVSTAMAALVDTRTGYVYGIIEESRARSGLTMAWGSDDVMTRTRSAAERDALTKLFSEFPAFWNGVVQKHRR
jgi:hypothetical protein